MRVAQLQAQNEELLSSSKKQAFGPGAVSDRGPRLREDFVPRRDEDVVRSMRDRQLDMQDAKEAGNAHELARLCQVVASALKELSQISPPSIVANAVRVIEEQDLCPVGSDGVGAQATFVADDSPGTTLVEESCKPTQLEIEGVFDMSVDDSGDEEVSGGVTCVHQAR